MAQQNGKNCSLETHFYHGAYMPADPFPSAEQFSTVYHFSNLKS